MYTEIRTEDLWGGGGGGGVGGCASCNLAKNKSDIVNHAHAFQSYVKFYNTKYKKQVLRGLLSVYIVNTLNRLLKNIILQVCSTQCWFQILWCMFIHLYGRS